MRESDNHVADQAVHRQLPVYHWPLGNPGWHHRVMRTPPTRTRVPSTRVSWLRLTLGLAVATATVVTAALFVAGYWNPWRLVVLLQWFANPWAGLAIVSAGAYLALWLLRPIRYEAGQRGAIAGRVALASTCVIGLILWGLLQALFRYEADELARSPDGERAVARVVFGGLNDVELRVWEGSGLLTREVGSLGRICHRGTAAFSGSDTVVVDQGYGDLHLPLDPETGAPLMVLAVRCPDPPIPATLEP